MKITSDIRRLCTDDETYRLVQRIVRATEDLNMAKAELRQYYNRHRRSPLDRYADLEPHEAIAVVAPYPKKH